MRLTLALSAVAICAALAPATASAANYDCTPDYSASAYSNPTTTASPSDFVALPDMTAAIPFAVTNKCVLVYFSAQIRAPAPGGVRFRLTLDGTPVGLPQEADFHTAGNKTDERAVTFIVPRLPADGATAQVIGIEYMSIDGSPVSVGRSYMLVTYFAM